METESFPAQLFESINSFKSTNVQTKIKCPLQDFMECKGEKMSYREGNRRSIEC